MLSRMTTPGKGSKRTHLVQGVSKAKPNLVMYHSRAAVTVRAVGGVGDNSALRRLADEA